MCSPASYSRHRVKSVPSARQTFLGRNSWGFMASIQCKFSSDLGVFTRLPPHRISLIKLAAHRLVEAYQACDHDLWRAVTNDANKLFGKNERGIMAGIALSMLEGK